MSITSRIDKLTNLEDGFLSETPPVPTSAKVGITSMCNYKCAFCAHVKTDHHFEMSPALYATILDKLASAGVKQLGVFFLGESMLVEWLPEAVRLAKSKFEYVFLTTNGSLCTGDRMRKLMDAGLDSIKFSLNYATPEQMREVAKVKEKTFDQVTANMITTRAIRDMGNYPTKLFASYIEYDDSQAERMQARLSEINAAVDEVYALPLYTQVGEAEGKDGWQHTVGNPGRAAQRRSPIPCWVLFKQAHIATDGTLSACCFDHAGHFDMGDLKTMSFEEAWHSEKFKALRRAHLAGNVRDTVCEKCIHG